MNQRATASTSRKPNAKISTDGRKIVQEIFKAMGAGSLMYAPPPAPFSRPERYGRWSVAWGAFAGFFAGVLLALHRLGYGKDQAADAYSAGLTSVPVAALPVPRLPSRHK